MLHLVDAVVDALELRIEAVGEEIGDLFIDMGVDGRGPPSIWRLRRPMNAGHDSVWTVRSQVSPTTACTSTRLSSSWVAPNRTISVWPG